MSVSTVQSNSNRYLIRLAAVALFAALALIVAGRGGSARAAGAQHTASSVAVKTRKIKGLGTVLVNAKGRTLYVFANDKQSKVTCTGSCAKFWPPLKWKSAAKPKAGGTAKAKLLSLDANPAGGKVVTYNRWPLYTYAGDSAPGQANGQNQKLNGGKWYVISPKGKVVKHS
jgi:predicted lipoprotein with Yx(FWY)xxD motif